MVYPTLEAEGALDLEVVGRKAAFLRDAIGRGCRVPPGFVVPIGASTDPEALAAALSTLEARTGARLFDATAPLVLAVRSSGRRSMPGELETLLGLGARANAVPALTERLGSRPHALALVRDSLRSFRRVARGVRPATIAPPRRGASMLPSAAELEREVADLEPLADVPADARDALALAIASVASLGRERAGEPIAVLVQAMALGGGPDRSGAAVVLSRHALEGGPGPVGEWALGVAGEALTAGRLVSPAPIAARGAGAREAASLERTLPEAFAELAGWSALLERAHRDAVELEVAIERGTPYLVQVRPAKLAPRALVRVVVALEGAGVISRDEALDRVSPEALVASGTSALTGAAQDLVLAAGLVASTGVAAGRLALDPAAVLQMAGARGDPVVFLRHDASPEDAPAVRAAAAVVTASGGLTSHAAVMSRALGRPCIVSASSLVLDEAHGRVGSPGGEIRVGEWVTVDGGSARLLRGRHEPEWTADVPEADTLLSWARARAPEAAADGPAGALRAARARIAER